MSESLRTRIISNVRRIVTKIGTGVLTDKSGRLDERRIASLAAEIASIRERGYLTALVTSGAIGAGLTELGMKSRPEALPELQAAAAVGQSSLMRLYNESFRRKGYHSAQMLLTREDFDNRRRYLNARNTLYTLFRLPAIPVINENDTVSTEEINFGDNDLLSALVAGMLGAELLIILTDVAGIFAPGKARPEKTIERVTPEVRSYATGRTSERGTGGMATKIEAARIATSGGAAVIVASGKRKGIISEILAGKEIGTLFLPQPKRLSSRKRWIGLAAKPRGRLSVDDGAKNALLERGRSLLPSGLKKVEGTFEAGDIVAITDLSGKEFARGLANYSSRDCQKVCGKKTSEVARILGAKPFDEVVHRDNMVLTY